MPEDVALDARLQHAFTQPLTWLIARQPDEVAGIIDQAHAHAKQGHWCIGWVAYEAASAFDPHLSTRAASSALPLAAFAVFDQTQPWPDLGLNDWQTSPWTTELNPQNFVDKVKAIHELIRAGEVYQINLTTPLQSTLIGPDAQTPTRYFGALHRAQPRGYNTYLDLSQAASDGSCPATEGGGGVSHILSVSPELFFQWDCDQLVTRPMKGTAARGDTPESDEQAAQHLRQSVKERAENLMIVDLLRNDLSRIAQVGTVQVPSLFDLQALPTVWQMTSTIQARTRPDLRLSEVFAALFPCGSITGAPKRRAMHHITALETAPRRAYCGAVGVIQPGGACTFNVAIRTVELSTAQVGNAHTKPQWQAQCGIGSGITLDATASGEALEWHHKQVFLRRAAQPFELLESLRLEDGQLARLPSHLARLHRTATHFAVPLDDQALQTQLTELAHQHPQGVFKVRLRVDVAGQIFTEAAPLPAPTGPIRVSLATQAMPPPDEFIWHKTTRRQAYQAFAPAPGRFDTLLYNRQGELTEFTIGNVAIELNGQWVTPPLSCGLLPGVMRESLLQSGQLTERVVTLNDLAQASGLALINSVRGWMAVDCADFCHHATQPDPS
ncbi:MAG: chorismate-binding protein [Burkholderiales bacterium]|nr:chorismate-binding protein [Burkholderiales bacterium]